MSSSHNKKRNSKLMYEFLVGTISRSLVENDQRKSSVALKILKRHFKPGTELYKEFRLVNSLIKTTVSSESVAASIMAEAKIAARSHDVKVLDREKSLLIRNVNHGLKDVNFYDQHINEYKMHATIQTLINDWRAGCPDLERVAMYEDQLVQWLMSEKAQSPDSTLGEDTPGSNRLLMKVMMQKLNEKYAGILNEDQKSIVRAYVWSTSKDDPGAIKLKLNEVKSRLLSSIEKFSLENKNEFIEKKVNEVRDNLLSESISDVDDDTVTRFMLYIKLNDELQSSE